MSQSLDTYHQGFFSKSALCSAAYLQHALLGNVMKHNLYHAKMAQTAIQMIMASLICLFLLQIKIFKTGKYLISEEEEHNF